MRQELEVMPDFFKISFKFLTLGCVHSVVCVTTKDQKIKQNKTTSIQTTDKKYAEELNLKRRIFLDKTGTKKTAFITMLTTFGVNENGHYLSTVQNQLTMDVLFEKI